MQGECRAQKGIFNNARRVDSAVENIQYYKKSAERRENIRYTRRVQSAEFSLYKGAERRR